MHQCVNRVPDVEKQNWQRHHVKRGHDARMVCERLLFHESPQEIKTQSARQLDARALHWLSILFQSFSGTEANALDVKSHNRLRNSCVAANPIPAGQDRTRASETGA